MPACPPIRSHLLIPLLFLRFATGGALSHSGHPQRTTAPFRFQASRIAYGVSSLPVMQRGSRTTDPRRARPAGTPTRIALALDRPRQNSVHSTQYSALESSSPDCCAQNAHWMSPRAHETLRPHTTSPRHTDISAIADSTGFFCPDLLSARFSVPTDAFYGAKYYSINSPFFP